MKKTAWKAVGAAVLTAASVPALAGAKVEIGEDSWLSLGAGMRTVFQSVEDGAPNDSDWSKDFDVQSIRLYLNGQVNDWIGITFNTEDIHSDGPIDTLDVIARFEPDSQFNVWIGKMLTPADRIEMNGPYYGVTWNQYNQPLYPSDQDGTAGNYGRDDGLTIWGNLGNFQYAVGAFDGEQGHGNQDDSLLYAGRFSYFLLAHENSPAYYTSSTYFGELGNILTLAASVQTQKNGTGSDVDGGDFTGYTLEVFSEFVLGAGVLNVEGEYKNFDADYTLVDPAPGNCFCLFDGDSWYGTAAFLFPQAVGPGMFQPYVRYVENSPSEGDDTDLTEVGLNYWIAGYNARLNLNLGSGDANASGYKQGKSVDYVSVGVQLQI